MRLNWFSPLPPQRTDIAHYTARIAGALMDRFDVVFWTDLDADAAALPAGARINRFDPALIGTREFNHAAFEAINIYNLGNDAQFHSDIAAAAQALPGIVVLHDTRLHHLTFERARANPDAFAGYLSAAGSLYGAAGLEIARSIAEAQGSTIDNHVDAMPFSELYLRDALGAICHSPGAAADIRARSDLPLLNLPLPFRILSVQAPIDRSFRAPWRFVVFGYLNSNRRLESVIEALGAWGDRHKFQLDIYGSLWDEQSIAALIGRCDLRDAVRFHGFVPEAELDRAIAEAHLAFNLRHPTMGEASGGVLRSWAFATPTVVTDQGWYAQIPNQAVLKVSVERERADLIAVLDGLATDPEAYREIGKAGLNRLEANHLPTTYAAALAGALTEGSALLARAAYRRTLERRIGAIGGARVLSPMLERATSIVSRLAPSFSLPEDRS